MAVDNLYDISTDTGLVAVIADLATADNDLQTGLGSATTALLDLQDVVLPNLVNSTTPGVTDLDYDALMAFTTSARTNEKSLQVQVNAALSTVVKALDTYFITYEGAKLRTYLSTADANAFNASAFVTNTAKMPVTFRNLWARIMSEDFIFTATKQTYTSGSWAKVAGWTADNLTLYGPAVVTVTQAGNTAAAHTYTVVVTCTPANGDPAIVSNVIIGGANAVTAPVILSANKGKALPAGTLAVTVTGTPTTTDSFTVQTS